MVTALVDQTHVLVAQSEMSEPVLLDRNPEHEAAMQLRQIVMATEMPMPRERRAVPFHRRRGIEEFDFDAIK